MKTQKKYPNLIVRQPHPQKCNLKKILIELPYPMVERMREIKNESEEFTTMSDFVRTAVVRSGLISTSCIEDVGLTDFEFKKRDELRALAPVPQRTLIKGGRVPSEVGMADTKRRLVK